MLRQLLHPLVPYVLVIEVGNLVEVDGDWHFRHAERFQALVKARCCEMMPEVRERFP